VISKVDVRFELREVCPLTALLGTRRDRIEIARFFVFSSGLFVDEKMH
jgi:hypothetical protein